MMEQEEEDRISKLPNELLHRIFTNIDSRVAVQTSVLSKRWVHLWTSLPVFNFVVPSRRHTDYSDVLKLIKFVKKFLNNRNPQYVVTSFNVDSNYTNMRILDLAMAHNVQHLRVRNDDFTSSVGINSAFLKTLHLSFGRQVNPMDWNLPNLTSLYLESVKFGKEISGFNNLKELTLAGSFEIFYEPDIFTINCPNLESLALSPDHRHCTFLVSAPKLLYFDFRSTHVPDFCAGDGFPLLKEVDIDIQIEDYDWEFYDDDRTKLTMQNHIKMLNSVRGTPLLKLSSETIQVLRRIPDFSRYQPSPFDNLKFLSLRGLPEMPTRSSDHVINYLLTNSPCAEILKGNVNGSQKFQNKRIYY